MMISHGVEISIAGRVGDKVCQTLTTMIFFFLKVFPF